MKVLMGNFFGKEIPMMWGADIANVATWWVGYGNAFRTSELILILAPGTVATKPWVISEVVFSFVFNERP